MNPEAKWIWLDTKLHTDEKAYCVAEISRAYRLMKNAVSLKIDVCADTAYKLWINGKYTGTGPVFGGDNRITTEKHAYYLTYELTADPETLVIRALVRGGTDASHIKNGFIFSCEITYDDGSCESIFTDEKWDIRRLASRVSDGEIDYTLSQPEWEKAAIVNYPAVLEKSPICALSEEVIRPDHKKMYVCPPRSSAMFSIDFDRIYSAYLSFSADGDDYTVIAGTSENGDEMSGKTKISAQNHIDYLSMNYAAVGRVLIEAENKGDTEVKISDVALLYRRYPVKNRGYFSSSDKELDRIYRLCTDTLEICRQDSHVRTPQSRELLYDIGDYYVQSLIGYMTFGDAELTRFDIVRIARLLASNGGVIKNSAYSLVWVMMLYDYYIYSGDTAIFTETEQALTALLDRFSSYTSSSGIVERAPDYMIIDRGEIDGFSLENPPKALGQAVITAYYYRALDLASRIYALRGNNKFRSAYRLRADAVKKGFNDNFYDKEKELYFAGLGTPDRVNNGKNLPENVNRRYYTRHVNILAVLFGMCEGKRAEALAERVASDKTLGDIQPYYMHWLLDAVREYRLFDKYGIKLIKRWTKLYEECPEGLSERWDGGGKNYSSASGGTPSYQLPMAMLGLKITKPGFEEISLSPKLYGLEYASICVPTPYGSIECLMKRGQKPILTIPAEIKYTVV